MSSGVVHENRQTCRLLVCLVLGILFLLQLVQSTHLRAEDPVWTSTYSGLANDIDRSRGAVVAYDGGVRVTRSARAAETLIRERNAASLGETNLVNDLQLEPVWSFQIPGSARKIRSSPAVGRGGVVFVTAVDGNGDLSLHAIAPPAGDGQGPRQIWEASLGAANPWPAWNIVAMPVR
jgi:outer membrane protein assembly factor BamB